MTSDSQLWVCRVNKRSFRHGPLVWIRCFHRRGPGSKAGDSFTSVPTVTPQGDRRSNGFVSFLCRGGYHNGLTRGRSPVQAWPKTFFQTGSRYRDWHSRLRHNWWVWETRCTSPQKHLNYNKLAIIIAFIGTKPRHLLSNTRGVFNFKELFPFRWCMTLLSNL